MSTGPPRSLEGIAVESSLAWLLQPLPVDAFLGEIWGATPHHIKRGRAGHFDGLLPGSPSVERLFEHVRPEPSEVRLVKGGEDRDPDAYRLADGGLDVDRIRDGFAEGYTVVLNGVERYVRAIASLSHAIEVDLNFPTRVNAYLTPPESTGFAPHYDPHDVLVLQIAGSKTWQVSGDDVVAPREMQRGMGVGTPELSSLTDVCLEPGDVLYLPRGQVHSAQTQSEPSLHLTVGLHAPTVLTLLTHLMYSLSLTDDRFHARLSPRHLDDDGVRSGLGDVVRDALKAVEDPGALEGALGTMENVLVRRGRCPPVGRIADTAAVDGRTLVQKYQPLYSRVASVPNGIALQFSQLSMNAGSDHEAAMRFLSASTKPFRVSDLPGLNTTQQAELARSLILSGFLIRLSDN
jgi:ribosomal protein L16 Arg81 hydroxylase